MTSTPPLPPEATAADATIVPPPTPVVAAPFEQLGLPAPVLANLARLGYHEMTPIQAASLPVALAGNVIIAQAKTGSGKTAAFGLPLLQRLDPRNFAVQAMVLCPTRELAEQVSQEIRRDGDLGITFPITYDYETYNQYGLEDYPGFAQAVQDAVSPSALIEPLELRPDAYVPQDIIASNPEPTALGTLGALSVSATSAATEGDDVIAMPDGGPYKIYGLGGNDSITGSAGGDYIDGGTGDDTMAGGRGNDNYVVDSTGDVIFEEARGGFDHVYASINYTLGAELEHLTLTGDAIAGMGNELRNTIHASIPAAVQLNQEVLALLRSPPEQRPPRSRRPTASCSN